MNIQLKKLKLLNFKGIRQFEVEFNDDITNIFGKNASGKTTIMDAFLWMCFGKDSSDRTTFEIKTLDENNNAYERIDHSVEAWLVIDGKETVLRRVLREKWTKKRGEAKDEFTGHIQDFYWDEVPLRESEYKTKMAAIIDEQLFKLLTNTSYFNGLKWQNRRMVLEKVAGEVSNAEVITKMEVAVTDELPKILESGKSLDEYRKMIAGKKKKIKDELILFPSRIDEANRSMPEERDFSNVQSEIDSKSYELETVEAALLDRSKAQKESQDEVIKLMNKKQSLSKLMMDIEFKEKSEVHNRKHERQSAIEAKKREVDTLTEKRQSLLNKHSEITKEIENSEGVIRALRERWEIENGKKLEFNDNEFRCPTCKREYPENEVNEKKVELSNNFNKNKSVLIGKIADEAKSRKEQIEDLKVKLSNTAAEGTELKESIKKLNDNIKELEVQQERLSANDEQEIQKAIAENKEYQNIKAERDNLQVKIESPVDNEVDNSELLQRKKAIQQNIDELKQRLSLKGLREKQIARLQELQGQEEAISQELADLENCEYTIDQFIKAKMTAIEDKVNSMFKVAKFKMFEQQINEGEKETCVTLINGVPYADANTAGKVQVGIDIITTLSEFYNVKAPIFVDNRESVTKIPETDSQIINLIVSQDHPKLTVGSKEAKALELFS